MVGSRSYAFSAVMMTMRCGGRLFERLQQRIGGLFVGAVHVIDQENAAVALVRQVLRAVF